MKFCNPKLETVIEINGSEISTIVIENRNFFFEILQDIYAQINGEPGSCVVSENDRPLSFSKCVDLTDSFLSFTLNRKTLQTKIVAALERLAVNSENYMQTAELLSEIEAFINELAAELDCAVECGKINAGALLKMAGLTIREDYDNFLERVFDYMELTREFDRDKLFIFVNMRAYFKEDELQAFFETVLSHEFKILLIDSVALSKLKYERRLIIDEDLCEIY